MEAPGPVCVMRQMPLSPEGLRHSEEGRLIEREEAVDLGRAEERAVEEAMRHRVRAPPEPNCDEEEGGGKEERCPLEARARNQEQILPGMSQANKA